MLDIVVLKEEAIVIGIVTVIETAMTVIVTAIVTVTEIATIVIVRVPVNGMVNVIETETETENVIVIVIVTVTVNGAKNDVNNNVLIPLRLKDLSLGRSYA